LNAKGADALKALGDALDQVLPCYTAGSRSREDNCPRTKAKIEAIFIEGHADSDRFRNSSVGRPPLSSLQMRSQVGRLQRADNRDNPAATSGSFFGFLGGQDAVRDPAAQADPRRATAAYATNNPPRDNLDLSALRATTTYRELQRAKQELSQYLSPHNTPVLSVSGYGEYRPVAPEPGESAETYKQRNRRIDLRILMATPRSEDAKQMQRDLQLLENQ
jgi:hypothetical protein